MIIILERISRFGDTAYKLAINGDGEVIYKGYNWWEIKTHGLRKARISKEKLKELVDQFYKINFFELEDNYDPERLLWSTITSIEIDGKIKTVRNQENSKCIENLCELNGMIDEITDSSKWVHYASEEEREQKKKDLQKRMEERKKIKVDKNLMITLIRGWNGDEGIYSLNIYGDGKVVYKGRDSIKTIGIITTKIPQESVEELVDDFFKVDFFSFKGEYESPIRGGRLDLISIKIGDKKKEVLSGALGGFSKDGIIGDDEDKLCYLEKRIDEIANSSRWVKNEEAVTYL